MIVRGLFSPSESEKIKDCLEKSEDIKAHAYGGDDGHGRISKMCLWNYAGNDVLGVVARWVGCFLDSSWNALRGQM